MKNYLYAAFSLVLFMGCKAPQQTTAQMDTATTSFEVVHHAPFTKPKLVVGIVVDQMRYDYLTRFYDRFTTGGFKRLMIDGYNCKNNHFNYIPTYTAPGHASVYTGTSPMNHGIIGNNWYDKFEKKMIYNAQDDSVESLGTTGKAGKMSPRRMLTSTVTDQLKLHTQGKAKVIGVSIKDRGAILPAGHAANAAYWYDGGDNGKFISSTYYMEELPEWVQNFNSSNFSDKYLKSWKTLYPIETYTASGKDDNEYERPPKGKERPTFPYDLAALKDKNGGYSILKGTPYGNSLVTDMAFQVLLNEKMGEDDITDFLTISYSSTDYVGHQYGVNSVELEDTYLRLDIELASLFKMLDEKLGLGNYTVFLTADHGAVHNPAYLMDMGIPAGYFDGGQLRRDLDASLSDKFGMDGIIEKISNGQIFFNHQLLHQSDIDAEDVEEYLALQLLNYPRIDKVFTREALMNTSFSSGAGLLVQNGFHHKRSGDLVFILEPGVIDYSKTGSTHGSSQKYDTHVPLLFYGAGIKRGATVSPTNITDIAPTISALLGIAFPNGATGQPIKEALSR